MKHVIQRNPFAIAIGSMNAASQLALAKEVAARGKQKRESLSQELNQKISAVDVIAKRADKNANILDDFEKGQLEKAFQDFIETQGMQAVLDTVCVDLGASGHFKLTSVMLALANADKIIKEEQTTDPDTGYLTGEKYTLADDSVVMMTAANSVLDNGDIRFDVAATGDALWKGINAGYHFVVRPIKKTVTVENEPYEVIERHDPVEQTHLQFDLTSQLIPCGDLNADVDLNDDGVIGNTGTDTGTDTGGAGDGAAL